MKLGVFAAQLESSRKASRSRFPTDYCLVVCMFFMIFSYSKENIGYYCGCSATSWLLVVVFDQYHGFEGGSAFPVRLYFQISSITNALRPWHLHKDWM